MKIKIGLETHVQLNSKSKIFCGCKNPVNLKEEAEPNSLTCEICLGFPGSKPVLNKRIVELASKIALALGCKIPDEMFFSRKTYFYPDMSKDFQITQYEVPLGLEGKLSFDLNGKKKTIRIKRIHIEEDPAQLVHVGGIGGKYVLIDYNRAGIPLVEIVTEPDFESPEEARLYLSKLTMILEYLGMYDPTTQAVLKSDANISLNPEGVEGTRVEIKNITGTKEVEDALKYEIIRQRNLISKSMQVKRETRTWNPDIGSTHEMRGKEEEAEYGYIFEPDLTKIELPEQFLDSIKKEIPELPDEKYERFVKKHKIQAKLAESLISEKPIADLFEEISKKINPEIVASFLAGYLKKTLNWNNLKYKTSGLEDEWIFELLEEFQKGKITDRNAEQTIRKMVEEKKSAKEIIKKYNLGKSEIDLESVLKKVLDTNKQAVHDFKKGEKKALEFLIGQVMKETRGQVDATEIRKGLKKNLLIN